MLPSRVISDVKDLQRGLELLPGNDELSREAHTNATLFFMCLVRCSLASKRVILEHQLSVAGWEWLIDRIKEGFQEAMAVPGDMVGTVAAQSIGEPTTQMCLNT